MVLQGLSTCQGCLILTISHPFFVQAVRTLGVAAELGVILRRVRGTPRRDSSYIALVYTFDIPRQLLPSPCKRAGSVPSSEHRLHRTLVPRKVLFTYLEPLGWGPGLGSFSQAWKPNAEPQQELQSHRSKTDLWYACRYIPISC